MPSPISFASQSVNEESKNVANHQQLINVEYNAKFIIFIHSHPL